MKSDFYNTDDSMHTSDFYKKLFKELSEKIFVFTVSSDNHFHSPLVSESICEMFELSNNIISDTIMSFFYNSIYKDDKIKVLRFLIGSRKIEKKGDLEFRSVLPKRGLCWFKVFFKTELHSDGSIVFLGNVLDITDFKVQQLQLEISDRRFRFAMEASTSGVWDWDLQTNSVFYSSQSLKILEQESTDIFDNPERWDQIVHPDDLKKYYATIQNHFENKTPFYENLHRVLTSSGKYKWILDRGKVIERSPDGKPLRVIGTHTDISSQKEKELELISAMELYSEHNSRLLNFSHTVSHNLNSHAGNIKLLLDMIDLEENSLENTETLGYLRTVSDDLNETIANLSQIVNIQNNLNVIKEPLDLNLYLKKNSNIISGYNHENKARIINNVAKGAIVTFNPAYLESVLLNFSTNAIKYAHPDRFPIIEFNFFVENEKKVLTITDNGLGIDLEKYGDLLFGMYKTFHTHEKAHGIGLYIAKNQIESMNGKVSVESKVGVGTTFKIIFSD
ncbi:PAS domain-containing protein [Flavobacterium sp. AED]|uniref:sensor histidine kinase n=1 Tax=Flavobacterium sp. AED TaxID=1423323 RepID=UPI00057E74C7|nr:PAS domain-containing protein [Flavobacterium sp. AED]KIA85694.1 histidine kinase [Flavobacterium sp. AED]